MNDRPEIVKVSKTVQETPSIKTIYFQKKLEGNAGQFVMAWLPGIDEKPFSISVFGKESAITVQKKGKFSEKMHELKTGDLIGIRGPYGKGFDISRTKNAIVIGGGCGIAPVFPLPEMLRQKGIKATIIIGAKTSEELFFEKSLEVTGKLTVCTDDGSKGKKCFTTQALQELLEKEKFDTVFACGPEPMLVKVFEACEAKGIECQLSLERFMKCGFGICGQCVIDDQLVCKDGPVFNSEKIRKLKEFGKFARLKSGKKAELKEYFAWRQC